MSKKGHSKKDDEDRIRKDLLPEVAQRFTYLYEIYDQENLGTIAEEDFPALVRSLGLCPTNAKMSELSEICKENKEDYFFVNSRLEEILTPLVLDVMLNPNHELAPPSDELLKLALQTLDLEKKGHLTEGDYRTVLSNNGEKLDPDEIEPGLDEAINPASGIVDFNEYAGKMLHNSHLSYKPQNPKSSKQQNPDISQNPQKDSNPGDTVNPSDPNEFANLTEPIP